MRIYIRWLVWITALWVLNAASCSERSVPVDNIEAPPEVMPADRQYAHVYQLLDGRWKGVFQIYVDTLPEERREAALKDLSPASLVHKNLQLSSAIQVEQEYIAETPYFQRVTIRDHYPERGETIISKGVNKVQDGKMWCVVKKPDETVIHTGTTKEEHTIIWQRNEQNPQKVEYFHETVGKNTYEIIGWGYYQGDDLSKMPRYWFHGKYFRQ